MVVFSRTIDLNMPARQKLTVPASGSDAFLMKVNATLDGAAYEDFTVYKDGVEAQPDDFGRYNVNKLAGDGSTAQFKLEASNGVVAFIDVVWVDCGTAFTDEGIGQSVTGVQKVNSIGPDAEGNVLVQEVFGRQDPTKSVDGDDMLEAIERISGLEAAKTYISGEVDVVKSDVDGLQTISAGHEQRITDLESSQLTGDYVPLSGGMMTGALSVAGSGTQVVEIDGTYVTIHDGQGVMRESWENIIDAGQYDPGHMDESWYTEHFNAFVQSEGQAEDGDDETPELAKGGIGATSTVDADGYGTTASTARLESETTEDGGRYKTTSKVIVATGSGADGEEPEIKSSVEIKAELHDEAGHQNVTGRASIEVKNGDLSVISGGDPDMAAVIGEETVTVKDSDYNGEMWSTGIYFEYPNGGGADLDGSGYMSLRSDGDVTKTIELNTFEHDDPVIYVKKQYSEDESEDYDATLQLPKESGTLARLEDIQAGGSSAAPKALPEYLYELDFASSYKTYGDEWRAQHFNDIDMGGCTGRSFTEGAKRWYDWKYDDSAVFVVKMPHRMDDEGEELYASIGVASLGSFLTKQMVASGQHTEIYKALPGMTQDGMNEHGVYAQINVVKSDPTKDEGWTGEELDVLGAVRYVLDHFDKGSDAAEWVASSCYLPRGFVESTGYSVMFLVRGKDDEGEEGVWIVQDGIMHKSSEGLAGVATNFRLYDTNGDMHWTREEVAQYDPYGSGLERFQVAYQGGWDEDTDAVNFTKAYTDNAYGTESPWYSDFVGGDLDLNSPDEDFEDVMDAAKEAYENRTRDGQTWQTVHFCKYDIENKTLTVRVQEGTEDTVFLMPTAGGGVTMEEVDERVQASEQWIYNKYDPLVDELSAEAASAVKEVNGASPVGGNVNVTKLIGSYGNVEADWLSAGITELSAKGAGVQKVNRNSPDAQGNVDVDRLIGSTGVNVVALGDAYEAAIGIAKPGYYTLSASFGDMDGVWGMKREFAWKSDIPTDYINKVNGASPVNKNVNVTKLIGSSGDVEADWLSSSITELSARPAGVQKVNGASPVAGNVNVTKLIGSDGDVQADWLSSSIMELSARPSGGVQTVNGASPVGGNVNVTKLIGSGGDVNADWLSAGVAGLSAEMPRTTHNLSGVYSDGTEFSFDFFARS